MLNIPFLVLPIRLYHTGRRQRTSGQLVRQLFDIGNRMKVKMHCLGCPNFRAPIGKKKSTRHRGGTRFDCRLGEPRWLAGFPHLIEQTLVGNPAYNARVDGTHENSDDQDRNANPNAPRQFDAPTLCFHRTFLKRSLFAKSTQFHFQKLEMLVLSVWICWVLTLCCGRLGCPTAGKIRRGGFQNSPQLWARRPHHN